MPQNPLSFNTLNPAGKLVAQYGGYQGDEYVSQFHGTKYTSVYNGYGFSGANPTAVTTSVGLATTYVGICLSNPATNTNNLVVRRVSATIIVEPASFLSVGLITGYSAAGIVTHTTPLTPFCSKIGATKTPLGATISATGKLDSACTLVGTPAWTQFFSTITSTTVPSVNTDLEDGIILIPGAYAAIGTTIASGSSGFYGSIEWAEFPV